MIKDVTGIETGCCLGKLVRKRYDQKLSEIISRMLQKSVRGIVYLQQTYCISAILFKMCFITNALIAITRILPNSEETFGQVWGIMPLGSMLSLLCQLCVFTFILLKGKWVRTLEIKPKNNFLWQTQQDEAYGLLFVCI